MKVAEKIKTVLNKSTAAEAMIEITDLCKSFGENIVLNHFNLVLNKGENVAVLGKSGSGKSVLISIYHLSAL